MSFDNERIRLLREMDGWTADGLAQELYAIFGDKDPAVFDNGISLDGSGGNPPITIRNFTDGDSIINVNDHKGNTVSTVSIKDGNLQITQKPLPAFNFNFPPSQPALGLNFTTGPTTGGPNLNTKPGPSTGGTPATGTDAPATRDWNDNPDRVSTTVKDDGSSGKGDGQNPSGGGGGAFAGVVASGTGRAYQVDVYFNGLTVAPTRVSVLQLQIASGETIPSGTWAPVFVAPDGSFFMQVPVWGA